MKKSFAFISMALLTVLVGLLWQSCDKREGQIVTSDLRQPVHKRSNYSIANALVYLNDSLNVRFCRPGDEYGETLVFIDTFEVPVTLTNEITDVNLENLADEIALAAGGHFYERGSTSKAPFMFSIKQAGNIESGYLPVSSAFIMEEGEPTDESDEYPYEDSWPYGRGAAIGCEGDPTGIDAPDLFRRDLRKSLVYGLKNGKGGFAYNRLVTICFSPTSNECNVYEIPYLEADLVYSNIDNPSDPTSNDNYYESLLFYNNEVYSNFHECLSDVEMNFHYGQMSSLAEDGLSEEVVDGRDLVQIEVGFFDIFGPNDIYFESMQAYYANIITAISNVHQLPDPDED